MAILLSFACLSVAASEFGVSCSTNNCHSDPFSTHAISRHNEYHFLLNVLS